jgi:tetratricopeptide (TPR) repeat protein
MGKTNQKNNIKVHANPSQGVEKQIRESLSLSKKHFWLASALVAALTLVVYLPALSNDFVNWDDPEFVYKNYRIMSFDLDFFHWIFTNRETQWSPLRWISHAIDYKIWKLNPMGHHLSSVIFHAFNALLVVLLVMELFEVVKPKIPPPPSEEDIRFRVKALITGVVTGLLFGLHPLHVESVVWVSERKDVLYTFFSLLGLIWYLKYSISIHKKQRKFFYLLCLSCFVLAVMSKAMAVTFPLVLIIMDVYPLRRIDFRSGVTDLRRIFTEKLPFIVISIAVSLINLGVHEERGVIAPLGTGNLPERILMVFKSLSFYLIKLVWPSHLAPYYPSPDNISLLNLDFIVSFILVATVSIFSLYLLVRGKKIWFIVWAYFVITLLPVLGIIKFSAYFVADRYTYMPSIGPFLLIGVGISLLWEKTYSKDRTFFLNKKFFILILACIFSLLSMLAIKQIKVWDNSITLWSQEVERYPRHPYGYLALGNSYFEVSGFQNAEHYYQTALDVAKEGKRSHFTIETLYRLGFMYLSLEQGDKARKIIDEFEKASSGSHYKIKILKGYYSYLNEDFNTAIMTYTDILKGGQDLRSTDEATVYTLLGDAYRDAGLIDKAFNSYEKALDLHLSFPAAYHGIAKVQMMKGNLVSASDYLSKILSIDPYNIGALSDMANLLLITGEPVDKALPFAKRAVSLNPPLHRPYLVMGTILTASGSEKEAEGYYRKAKELHAPEYLLLLNKAWAYSLNGDMEKQEYCLRELLKLNGVPEHLRNTAQKTLSRLTVQ